MKTIILAAIAVGAAFSAAPPVQARHGCGTAFHRAPNGACRPNVRGGYYRGHGYWDGRRYWKARYRYHGHWRYR